MFGDQGVDGLQRLVGVGVPEIGDGAGVAGRVGGVLLADLHEGEVGRVHEAPDLGLHDLEVSDGLRRVLHVPVGLRAGPHRQGFDPVVAQRVVDEVGVLLGVGEDLLVAERIEEIDQALTGIAGLLEIGDRRLVSLRFLHPRIGQDIELGEE